MAVYTQNDVIRQLKEEEEATITTVVLAVYRIALHRDGDNRTEGRNTLQVRHNWNSSSSPSFRCVTPTGTYHHLQPLYNNIIIIISGYSSAM